MLAFKLVDTTEICVLMNSSQVYYKWNVMILQKVIELDSINGPLMMANSE